MGREVGGGIGTGKTCEPKAFSFQCMTKFTTNKKKNKINILFCNLLLSFIYMYMCVYIYIYIYIYIYSIYYMYI